MGLLIKRMEVRAAATLSGAAQTSAISIRGAVQVWFELKATDAGTLTAAGTKIEVTNDGTNWISTGTSSSAVSAKSGGLASINTGVAVTALNAGPATYALVNLDFVSTQGSESRVIRALSARLTLTPTTTVAGLSVVAFVAYDSDGPTRVVTVTNDEGPNI